MCSSEPCTTRRSPPPTWPPMQGSLANKDMPPPSHHHKAIGVGQGSWEVACFYCERGNLWEGCYPDTFSQAAPPACSLGAARWRSLTPLQGSIHGCMDDSLFPIQWTTSLFQQVNLPRIIRLSCHFFKKNGHVPRGSQVWRKVHSSPSGKEVSRHSARTGPPRRERPTGVPRPQ